MVGQENIKGKNFSFGFTDYVLRTMVLAFLLIRRKGKILSRGKN